jgi:hypothetical protein
MEQRREMERRATMLVFVPQSYIALVYAGGELRAVVEAGVGFVPHSQGLEVHYVYLQVEAVEPETVH